MAAPAYGDSVFVNCPFDDAYTPLFHALIFAIHDCGFLARCAQEAEDSGSVRIAKIKAMTEECQHGIHDISRVELDRRTKMPRFNMPFELGLFLGTQEYGSGRQRQKRSLVLDTDAYRYKISCSDIGGQDIRAHENDPAEAIRATRNWLNTFRNPLGGSSGTTSTSSLLPGARTVAERYLRFRNDLPTLCGRFKLDPNDLQFVGDLDVD